MPMVSMTRGRSLETAAGPEICLRTQPCGMATLLLIWGRSAVLTVSLLVSTVVVRFLGTSTPELIEPLGGMAPMLPIWECQATRIATRVASMRPARWSESAFARATWPIEQRGGTVPPRPILVRWVEYRAQHLLSTISVRQLGTACARGALRKSPLGGMELRRLISELSADQAVLRTASTMRDK